MKKFIGILIIILVIIVLLYGNREAITARFFAPTQSIIENGDVGKGDGIPFPVVVADKLNIPWEIEFLPGGDILVTERSGRLLRIGDDRKVIEISGVSHRGEGGLLGLALDPAFEKNGLIYLYLTTSSGEDLTNQVERYKLDGSILSERKVLISGIPGASIHDGGRIAFGLDGMLYITTGDAGEENEAQNKNSLAGKILRINPDGTYPKDNPFINAVYSYGHRNVQGIAWDANGQLWATEHGRSGAQSGYDELNKISKGANYGWPETEGSGSAPNMISPQLHSGADETWAPAGMEYLSGHLIFAGLRGQSLYVTNTSDGVAKNLKKYFSTTYGRLRTIKLGPDGMLYMLTNNRDGRGKPDASDDKIIKFHPSAIGL